MRTIILIISMLLVFAGHAAAQDTVKIEVVKFSWSMYSPDREMLLTEPLSAGIKDRSDPLNKQVLGQLDRNDPLREKTVEEKSRDLARVESAAARSATAKPENMFLYELKVKNTDSKAVKSFVWQYESDTAAQSNSARRFLCIEKIKAGDSRTLKILSSLPPLNVVDASASKEKSGKNQAFDIVIMRVEYTDGTTWQRTGWDSSGLEFDSPRVAANLKYNDCTVL